MVLICKLVSGYEFNFNDKENGIFVKLFPLNRTGIKKKKKIVFGVQVNVAKKLLPKLIVRRF